MTEPKYGEPWAKGASADTYPIIEGGSDIVCQCSRYHEAKGYSDRIIACVNACAGINPEAVPMMREACEQLASIGGGSNLVGGVFLDCARDAAKAAIATAEAAGC